MQQHKQNYSTTRALSDELDKFVHTSLETRNLKKLATELHFDIDEEATQLSDASRELVLIVCSATLRDELRDKQRGAVAHASELASLINRCMRDDNDISKADVVYYSRRLSEERKKAGLIQYEDIAD